MINFVSRQKVAEAVAKTPVETAIDEHGLGFKAHELIVDLGDDNKYIRRHLASTTAEALQIEEGSPRHWFLMLTNPAIEAGCVAVEFGVNVADVVPIAPDEVRFAHELRIDELLRTNEDAATDALYALTGGTLANHVRDLGHTAFAGVEIQYGVDPKTSETATWTTLIYSHGLLETGRLLRKIRQPNKWQKELAKPENSVLAAEKMAVSGLVLARRN